MSYFTPYTNSLILRASDYYRKLGMSKYCRNVVIMTFKCVNATLCFKVPNLCHLIDKCENYVLTRRMNSIGIQNWSEFSLEELL